jgi:hypothetical protein
MRHALSIAIVATLLLGFIDVVAAGSKTVVTKNHATPASGVGIAVPSGITCFHGFVSLAMPACAPKAQTIIFARRLP